MLIGQNLKNKLINGGFDYWQRNTTFANPTSFTADRWAIQFDGTIGTFSVSRQDFALGQTDVPGSPRYFLRWDHTVAGSGSTNRSLVQRIESVRTLEGKKATLAFYAKADAARTLGVRATQSFGSGGSPSANVPIAEQFVDLTPSWQRFVVTFDVPSISGKTLGTNGDDFLQFDFRMPVNTVMTIDLAQAMFVEGESAGDFELAGGDLPGELKLCQRYYEKSYELSTVPGTATAIGRQQGNIGGTAGMTVTPGNQYLIPGIRFSVRKRAAPTVTLWDTNGTINSWYVNGFRGATTVGTTSESSCYILNGSGVNQIIGSMNDDSHGHWAADAEI